MNSGTIGTIVTVGGIAAIALTSTNGETRTAAISAIAGLSSPLGQLLTVSRGQRRQSAAVVTVGRPEAEFSGGDE